PGPRRVPTITAWTPRAALSRRTIATLSRELSPWPRMTFSNSRAGVSGSVWSGTRYRRSAAGRLACSSMVSRRTSPGPALHWHATLLLHRFALVVEVLVGDGERAHPVGFQPQREVQPIRGQGLPKVGAVLGGAPVHYSAGAVDVLEVLRFLHVGRPLEHHVLEEVREPGAAGAPVAGAAVVPHGH